MAKLERQNAELAERLARIEADARHLERLKRSSRTICRMPSMTGTRNFLVPFSLLISSLDRVSLILQARIRTRSLNQRDKQVTCSMKKRERIHSRSRPEMVGAIGFEPTTSRSRTERSTRLSHAP